MVQKAYFNEEGYKKLMGRWHRSYANTTGLNHARLYTEYAPLYYDKFESLNKYQQYAILRKANQLYWDEKQIRNSEARGCYERWEFAENISANPSFMVYVMRIMGNIL